MKSSAIFYFLIVTALSPVLQHKALACASCGSGSDDPLILWPSEQLKTYIGFSSSGGFEVVGAQGERGTEAGPTARDSLTMAVGKALREDLFATITTGVQQNRKSVSSLRSVADPMIAARWSWLMPDFTEPLRPQIQLMGSYKFAQSRSLQETQRLDLLDAFGTGIPETKLGLDVFWGMGLLKGGFALATLFPEERKLGSSVVFPGNALRFTGTFGMAIDGASKVLVGTVLEKREQRRDNGLRIVGSEVISTSIFLTGDWGFTQSQTLRVSITDKGSLGSNRNMIASRSASVAWLAAWD